MLSAALTRALTTPAFVAADFVPTHWDSAEQKAKFANALLRFVAQDFPRSKFHESFYRRLSNTFGHIAKLQFGRILRALFPDRRGQARVPRAVRDMALPRRSDLHLFGRRARRRRASTQSQIVAILSSQIAVERRRRELALLSELKARYEPIAAAPATAEIPDLFG